MSKPDNIIVLDNQIAIKWLDGGESFVKNKRLRDRCPCANCSGESDVFGNIYKNINVDNSNPKKYIIKGYVNIGHYGIKIIWGDGHDAGIYTFDLIKSLDVKK